MKTKFYHLFADGVDSKGVKHTVMVVGKFTQSYVKSPVTENVKVEVKPNSFVKGELSFKRKQLHRSLTVGVAICNPADKFDEEIGIKLAKKRIEKGEDAGTVETNDVTMLTKDLILAELQCKLDFITKNIDKYIGQ